MSRTTFDHAEKAEAAKSDPAIGKGKAVDVGVSHDSTSLVNG